jgi:FkbM family methyltransferase
MSEFLRRVRKGLTLSRYPDLRREVFRHRVAAAVEHRYLREYPARTFVDVGANRGQFALIATHFNPGARIHAFEPLASARGTLEELAGEHEGWRVYPVALSDRPSEATLYVSRREAASSLLPITERMTEFVAGTEAHGQVTVEVARLDEVLEPTDIARPSIMKIDVQGAELDVLRGGAGLLPHLDLIVVEASFTELYAGQAFASDIIEFLQHTDPVFDLVGVYNPQYDQGRCVQADFLFRTRSAQPEPERRSDG